MAVYTFLYRVQSKPALSYLRRDKAYSLLTASFGLVLLLNVIMYSNNPIQQAAQSLVSPMQPLQPLSETKSTKEVFGFAPYWTFSKLDNVDFDILTTLAYFSITVLSNGELDRSDPGYQTFKSRQATELFKKAHDNGTRVVLTITQMNNAPIRAILDDPEAQARAITQTVEEVQSRGIDGVNIDLEYGGNPGPEYRAKFTKFVEDLTLAMHQSNPNSKVTVSVYAASAKDPKIYDIAALSGISDGIFMMAYDFATASADQAIPTAPLYGHKEGQYWYDVATAVEDFLAVMPADKLILGVPWYGYNYSVNQPGIKADTYYGSGTATQTYAVAQENITPAREDITDLHEGWDDLGQVGWKAYYSLDSGSWRMIFLEDSRSLSIKYDFAKDKDLAGVGVWALGFDGDGGELWGALRQKFGSKLADHSLVTKAIAAEENYE